MPCVQIEKMAFGGAGFGRIDGKACFVPYTAPGDLAEISIVKSKSSYAEGSLTTLLLPSTSRVQPVCPVFGRCGGCNWQHISYEEQCVQKESILAEIMWRTARVPREVIKPAIRSGNEFAYRQRIQLKVNFTGGKLSLGFFKAGSHFVVDLPGTCAIAAESINSAISEIRKILTSATDQDKVPQVDLVAGSDSSIVALFHHIGGDPAGFADHLLSHEKKLQHLSGASVQTGRKDTIKFVFGPELMSYTIPSPDGKELDLSYSPDGFSQVNFAQNRRLVESVTSYCTSIRISSVLDLFCGNGNFSLPVAALAGRVHGLEAFDRSISLARANAANNGISNVSFSCEDATAGLEKLADRSETFDLVMLDPPRSGADQTVKVLHRLKPQYLIYISCDPPTLGRDLSILLKNGFRIDHIQPVDMFPQTYHLENAVFLEAV